MKLYLPVKIETEEQLIPYQNLDDVYVIFDGIRVFYHSGEWSHDDGPAGGAVHFPLCQGDELIVLVPIEAGSESFKSEIGTWTRYTTAWEQT